VVAYSERENACVRFRSLRLLVLFTRRRARSFPAFTAYVAENIVTTIVLYIVLNHFSLGTYRMWFWLLGLLDEVLQLLVVYELAVHVFRPTGVWARDVNKTFIRVVCASVVVALLLTWLADPTAHLSLQIFILRSNFFSAALMSELFAGMVVLSATAGLPWRTHVARIAQGLGTYSMVCVALDIIVNYVNANRHPHLLADFADLQTSTYFVCEVFWIVMLWQKAPAPRELPESMRMQIYSLQKRVEYDLIKIRTWRGN
jgi:hypothetical protein